MVEEKLKAKLMVVLKAGSQVIAEDDDPQLWQKVFAAITAGTSDIELPANSQRGGGMGDQIDQVSDGSGDSLLTKLAADMKVEVSDLKGACDPTMDEPFIHLDRKAWASWRKRTPEKGRSAITPDAIVATLLALWFVHLKRKHVTFKDLRSPLVELGITSKNIGRSINNCLWLQLKNKDQIRLHPSHMEAAISAARTFVISVEESDKGE